MKTNLLSRQGCSRIGSVQSKSETRRPKAERRPKSEVPNPQPSPRSDSPSDQAILGFPVLCSSTAEGGRVSAFFRPSGFGLRISGLRLDFRAALLSRSLAESQAPRLRGIGISPARTPGGSNNGQATVRRPQKRVCWGARGPGFEFLAVRSRQHAVEQGDWKADFADPNERQSETPALASFGPACGGRGITLGAGPKPIPAATASSHRPAGR
jgi:hypothetical protein